MVRRAASIFSTCVLLWWATPAVPAESTTYRVAGLTQPATIQIDRWGVPHIYAGNHYDAFYLQGFNAARDRLWQIDTWRRRGLGELAAAFGPSFIAQDRAARLFLFRGDMYREWLAYGSDAKRIAEHFVAGINAFIDLTGVHPELLSPEFALLDYAPARWRAEDVVRIRRHGLWRNAESELTRARLWCEFGAKVDALRRVLEPPWTPTAPEGLDPCNVPDDVLHDYRLANAPLRFEPFSQAASAQDVLDIGSNNWAIAPTRTATGRAILANDPHRAHGVPSLRYISHLSAPDLDVIGGGEPALPGISIGHNDRIAFGLTIFEIDQEDLYVYQTDDTGEHYRYRDQWQQFERVTDTIAVRDGTRKQVELEFTVHGPVLARDADNHRAYALRAGWLEAGMAPYFGSVEYMRAENWRQFVGALNRWGAPAENQVYADIEGNIGYKPAGLFPRRRSWDGLLPVPGDGRYEWDGFFDMDALPVEFNPARGFIATANAMNLPADYPIDERRVGFEWTAPWRHRRIHEVLAAQPKHTIADSIALQRDYVSVLARGIVDAVMPTLDATPAKTLLAGWHGALDRDSAPAALFMIWYERHLKPALLAELVGAAAATRVRTIDSRAVLDRLEREAPRWKSLLDATLAAAWSEAHTLLGDDATQWRWGDLHHIRFIHPLLSVASPDLAAAMALPVMARGGSADTPNNTGGIGFDVQSGASFRMILDMGNWDAARMTNAPGQSGDPRSAFYGNLLEGWANDASFPLLYSRKAVDAATVATIHLEPRADKYDE